jgi:hypothetical protein
MADIALCHFVRFLDRDGNNLPNRNYQNFWVAESRTYNTVSYAWGPFLISGSRTSRNGDESASGITTIPNDVSVGLLTEAAMNAWLVSVETVAVTVTPGTPPTFAEGASLATELWSCTALQQDVEKITLGLGSPLDAARAQVPKRVLGSRLVGSVPPTGNILAS